MPSLAILIPIALLLVALALALFLWAVRSNQYDDLDRRGSDILFDDDLPASPTGTSEKPERPNDAK